MMLYVGTIILGHAQLEVTLDQPSQTGVSGSTLTFTGTIQNTGTSTVFLNGDSLAVTDAATDDSAYLAGAPESLDPGQTYSGTLFTASLASTALPGSYTGFFSIAGGGDGDTFTSLSSSPVSISVAALQATVTLSNLTTTYDGTPQTVTATTTPSGLEVDMTYNGSSTPPTEAGSYVVVGAVADPTYQGIVTGTLVIAQASQNIILPALTILSYAHSPLTLYETATSGLPLSFSLVSGPATVSGTNNNILTFLGTGTLTLQASQAGNNDYLPATSVNQTFLVASSASFNTWETQFPTLTDTGAAATPQNDGVPNLLKYLYDINPSAPMSATDRTALPVVDIDTITHPGTEYLTLTYRQYALETGITVNVQTSPDLQTWTTVAVATMPNPTILEAGVSIVQKGTDSTTGDPIIQAQVPVTSAKQFIRLNVTQP